VIRDVLRWWKAEPERLAKDLAEDRGEISAQPDYRKFSCSENPSSTSTPRSTRLHRHGAALRGRDLDDTIVISMRCGQDSDCNPSNAGGVLATTIGRSKLAPRYVSEINPAGVFSHTAYSFPALVEVCEKLARQAVVKHGGRIEKTDKGDVFVIPVSRPKPGKLEQCWEPGPIAGSKFTADEMEKIEALSAAKQLQADLQKVAPGWKMTNCGPDMAPGLREEYRGKKPVFMTHPLNREVGCSLTKTVEVPKEGETTPQSGCRQRRPWRLPPDR
jgi:hypothetical protein